MPASRVRVGRGLLNRDPQVLKYGIWVKLTDISPKLPPDVVSSKPI
jgi:hypothetical protein